LWRLRDQNAIDAGIALWQMSLDNQIKRQPIGRHRTMVRSGGTGQIDDDAVGAACCCTAQLHRSSFAYFWLQQLVSMQCIVGRLSPILTLLARRERPDS
jgi:hypothetical protein